MIADTTSARTTSSHSRSHRSPADGWGFFTFKPPLVEGTAVMPINGERTAGRDDADVAPPESPSVSRRDGAVDGGVGSAYAMAAVAAAVAAATNPLPRDPREDRLGGVVADGPTACAWC